MPAWPAILAHPLCMQFTLSVATAVSATVYSAGCAPPTYLTFALPCPPARFLNLSSGDEGTYTRCDIFGCYWVGVVTGGSYPTEVR